MKSHIKENISKRIIIRYSLFQIPGLIIIFIVLVFIKRWIEIPSIVFWGIILAWVVKDIVLFFYTWGAYQVEKKDRMIGMHGITMDNVIESGYISVNGERWRAVNQGNEPVEKGKTVRIHDRKGLTLFIKEIK